MRKPSARPVAAVALMLAVGARRSAPAAATTTTAPAAGASRESPLTGAGSTFAQPVYAAWAQEFLKVESGAKVNYQAIGSGGGVEAFANQTVDFGATDVPLKSDRRGDAQGRRLHRVPDRGRRASPCCTT